MGEAAQDMRGQCGKVSGPHLWYLTDPSDLWQQLPITQENPELLLEPAWPGSASLPPSLPAVPCPAQIPATLALLKAMVHTAPSSWGTLLPFWMVPLHPLGHTHG